MYTPRAAVFWNPAMPFRKPGTLNRLQAIHITCADQQDTFPLNRIMSKCARVGSSQAAFHLVPHVNSFPRLPGDSIAQVHQMCLIEILI